MTPNVVLLGDRHAGKTSIVACVLGCTPTTAETCNFEGACRASRFTDEALSIHIWDTTSDAQPSSSPDVLPGEAHMDTCIHFLQQFHTYKDSSRQTVALWYIIDGSTEWSGAKETDCVNVLTTASELTIPVIVIINKVETVLLIVFLSQNLCSEGYGSY